MVGKFITLVELGCFSLALSISGAAAKGLQQIIVQVFFPMMSDSLREDREAAVIHYKKTRHLLLVISAGLSIGFIVGSHEFVSVVLGSKYAMAGWMLQLLGVREHWNSSSLQPHQCFSPSESRGMRPSVMH